MTLPGTERGLARAVERLSRRDGIQAARNMLAKREIALGLRKPSLAIYDHAFQFIGGAQKYGLTLAAALLDIFDITILVEQARPSRGFPGVVRPRPHGLRGQGRQAPVLRGKTRRPPRPGLHHQEDGESLSRRQPGERKLRRLRQQQHERDGLPAVERLRPCLPFPGAAAAKLLLRGPLHVHDREQPVHGRLDRRPSGGSPRILLYPPVDMPNLKRTPGPRIRSSSPSPGSNRREQSGSVKWSRPSSSSAGTRPDVVGDWQFVLAGGSPSGKTPTWTGSGR